MKIVIFETDHFEVACSTIKLFDTGSNEIIIYTTPHSYRQLLFSFDKPDRYKWVIQKPAQTKQRFILQMFRDARKNKPDILYLNTVLNNFFLYALLITFLPRATRTIVTLHAFNVFFKLAPAFSPKKVLNFWGRKALLASVKDFVVLSQTMLAPLQTKLSARKRVHWIPGAIFDEKTLQSQLPVSSCINLVIPGSVDGRRRNYDDVFLLLQLLEDNKIPVTITLLGAFYKIYGGQVLLRCRQFHHNYTKLNFYTSSVVDQQEFERVMNDATFVWSPSVINTVIEDGVSETYGQTITSGNIFDIIKHAKPFLIPGKLNIDPYLERSSIRYNSIDELYNFISSIHFQNIDYLILLKAATEASQEYTIQKIRDRNIDIFKTSENRYHHK